MKTAIGGTVLKTGIVGGAATASIAIITTMSMASLALLAFAIVKELQHVEHTLQIDVMIRRLRESNEKTIILRPDGDFIMEGETDKFEDSVRLLADKLLATKIVIIPPEIKNDKTRNKLKVQIDERLPGNEEM